MPPIAEELRDAVSKLTAKIKEAEEFLALQPGVEEAAVELDPASWGEQRYLEVMRDRGFSYKICVRDYSLKYEGDMPTGRPIEEYPLSIRIELSEHIADLIERAVAAESEIAKDAIGAAYWIDHTIKQFQGNGPTEPEQSGE